MKMKKILTVAAIATVALSGATVQAAQDDYYQHHEPTYWQGFKNALSDLNPFSDNLGHDWTDTQHRVESIYHETQRDAQRRVNELKEDQLTNKDLQEKIANIYLDAANEAEHRIERLKRPIFSAIFRRGWKDHEEVEEDSSTLSKLSSAAKLASSGARDTYDRARDSVRDAAYDTTNYMKEKAGDARDYVADKAGDIRDGANYMKRRLQPHEKAGLLDTATKKMSESYRQAVHKAKELAAKAPSATESIQDAKKRVVETYDEYYGRGHHEARTTFGHLRDALGYGLLKAGGMATGVATKTWHLFLHMLLGAFWLTLGAAAYSGVRWYIEKQTFKKQLAAHIQGPVVLSKVFTVLGTDDTQRKFQEYWTGAASQFFSRQPGLRKFSLQRGVDIGSSTWGHLSEWNSIEDLRRALAQPELAELKKRMPKGVMSTRGISQVVSTGKGGAGNTAPQEGDVVRSEGLRNRGPGIAAQ